MRLSDLADVIFSTWKHNPTQSIFVMGPPGIGKTSVAAAVVDRIRKYNTDNNVQGPVVCHIKDLSSSLPEDLNGLPKTDGEVMRFVPDTWLAECCNPEASGILILDDLPAATASIQVAARQLVLDKRIHEHRLSSKVIVVVTGNRREDASAAKTLPAHFRNSVLTLEAEANLADWTSWMRSKDADRSVTDFLAFRPQHFSRLPVNADQRGVFATPRTWKMLSDLMPVALETKKLFEISAGLVGEGVSAEFVAFKDMSAARPDPKAVLDAPYKPYPSNHDIWSNRPDLMVAVLSGISYYAGKAKKTKDFVPVDAYVKAVAYLCSRSTEYFEFAFQAFRDSGGREMAFLTAAQQLSTTDSRVAQLKAKLREVFA